MSMSNVGGLSNQRNPQDKRELEPYVRHPYAYAQYPSEDKEAAREIRKKTWWIGLFWPATGTRITVDWPIRRLRA